MRSTSLIIELRQKTTFVFLASAIAIFSFSAFAKMSASYSPTELKQFDPFLLFLTVKQLLILTIAIEVSVVILILMSIKKSPKFGLVITIWLTLLFLAYRLAFAFAPENNKKAICKCFGGPGGIIGKHSDAVGWILIFYLLGAGTLLLIGSALHKTTKSND